MASADQIDRELAAAALEKRRRGERPHARELAALRRIERAREEADRWRYYAAIPKRHWQRMSGRQQKILNEQAARYGLPIADATIDLSAVVRWLHDFLAANARRLAETDDDSLLSGDTSPALERYRLARAKREEWLLERDLGHWLRRDQVHEGLALFAGVLRDAGATLQRQCGAEAHEILDDALTDAMAALATHFGPDEQPEEQADAADDGDLAGGD